MNDMLVPIKDMFRVKKTTLRKWDDFVGFGLFLPPTKNTLKQILILLEMGNFSLSLNFSRQTNPKNPWFLNNQLRLFLRSTIWDVHSGKFVEKWLVSIKVLAIWSTCHVPTGYKHHSFFNPTLLDKQMSEKNKHQKRKKPYIRNLKWKLYPVVLSIKPKA